MGGSRLWSLHVQNRISRTWHSKPFLDTREVQDQPSRLHVYCLKVKQLCKLLKAVQHADCAHVFLYARSTYHCQCRSAMTSSTLIPERIFCPSVSHREGWRGSSSPHRKARGEATETQALNSDFTSVWKMAQRSEQIHTPFPARTSPCTVTTTTGKKTKIPTKKYDFQRSAYRHKSAT